MLCQRCKEKPAVVHVTKIINGEKSGYHLCEQCAKESGDFMNHFTQAHAFDFNHLLSGLLNMDSSPGYSPAPQTSLRCSTCGMTYPQFTKVGRFGCPDCYDNFSSRLDPLLRRIQTSTAHTGKVPENSGEQLMQRKTLEQMRKQLHQAVASEQYEKAAKLRDEIRQLENNLDS